MDYAAFLQQRQATAPAVGFQVAEQDLPSTLSPFQRRATALSLARGRAALFEDTGLGKSRQILVWMDRVARHTRSRCLLLTPLAVAHQFVRDEAPAVGVQIAYCRSQAEADASGCALIVTNYEMASRFDPAQFAGVALDEADIISNFVGKTNRLLCAMFSDTPYRLVATATPAPNDLIELGRYSEFLGVMESGEMLTRYFIRDSQSAATLRLRHWAAAGPFWDWLASWAICIGLPSDLGDYSDEGYLLPPLTVEQHTVDVSYDRALAQGQLFPGVRQSATDMWATKHETLAGRIARTVEIVNESHNLCLTGNCAKLATCHGNQNTKSADAPNTTPTPSIEPGGAPPIARPKKTENICRPTTRKTKSGGKSTERPTSKSAMPDGVSVTQTTPSIEQNSKHTHDSATRQLSETRDSGETLTSAPSNTMPFSSLKMDAALSVEPKLATNGNTGSTLTTATPQELSEGCSAQIATWASESSKTIPNCSHEQSPTSPSPKLEPWIIWCSTDDEQRSLAAAFGDRAISVYGSLSAEEKERRIVAWMSGERPILISKPSICGQGLNFQHCSHMIFCSPTFSFKAFYQGLRRIYRFRQVRPVTCYVVIAETEESVIAAVERKQQQHRELHAQARAAMKRQRQLGQDWRVALSELRPLVVPQWLRAA